MSLARLSLSSGKIGGVIVAIMLLACIGSLGYTLGTHRGDSNQVSQTGTHIGPRRYEASDPAVSLLPPTWAKHAPDESQRVQQASELRNSAFYSALGTDRLGRSMLVRCLLGGAISIGIGLAAAIISVGIGTMYGTVSGYCGGRTDAAMMRIVDVLYGLPYILLVVLLAVAVDGLIDSFATGAKKSAWNLLSLDRRVLNILTLLIAIGGVSWLTTARVIRGQVLSLKAQPFMEACRAIGVPLRRQFTHHLLPNLTGPIVVYATLTVPAAILSESFLSFLGIGVQEPLPSWGNLAAAGLSELNTVRSRWWLLVWPCSLIAITLLALNFLGESLRERLDVRRK